MRNWAPDWRKSVLIVAGVGAAGAKAASILSWKATARWFRPRPRTVASARVEYFRASGVALVAMRNWAPDWRKSVLIVAGVGAAGAKAASILSWKATARWFRPRPRTVAS